MRSKFDLVAYYILYSKLKRGVIVCDKIKNLKETIARIVEYKSIVNGETNTRKVMIDPILHSLGYDTSNPYDVINEFTCDFGIKKGEKVDYALMRDSEVTIIVEAKSIEVELGLDHISQLFRYFSVTDAQIGILTNGLDYWFFTDMWDKNIMDTESFFKFNIESITAEDLDRLVLFHKDTYNIDSIKALFENLCVRERVEEFLKAQTKQTDAHLLDLLKKKLKVNLEDRVFELIVQNEFSRLFSGDVAIPNVVMPTVSSTDTPKVLNLDAINSFECTGTKVTKITVEGKDYPVRSWADTIFTLLNHLALTSPTVDWLDGLDGTLDANKGFIRKSPNKLIKSLELGATGLYVDMHGSSYMHVQRMKVLCRNAKLSADKVVLTLS